MNLQMKAADDQASEEQRKECKGKMDALTSNDPNKRGPKFKVMKLILDMEKWANQKDTVQNMNYNYICAKLRGRI